MNAPVDQSTRRAVLAVAVLASFVTPFMGSAVNVALPTIGRDFALDAIFLSWISTSYLLSAVVCLLPFGKLADIHGRRRIFLLGQMLFAISSVISALAVNGAMLIVARLVQGVGGAMIFGTGVAVVTSVFPAGERGRALGFTVAAVYVGLSLGPVVGGVLTHNLGWRSIFWLNALLGVALVALTRWKLKQEFAGARGDRFDWIGSGIYASAMICLTYGMASLPGVHGAALLAVAVVALIAFVLWEQRCDFPILDVGLFRENIVFAFSNLAALLNYSATFAVGFFLSLYLQYVLGFNAQHAGAILLAQPILMAILSPIAGHHSDRIEPRVVASLGMALTVVGLVMLIFLGNATSSAYVVIALATLGIGFGLFSSPNTNAIMGSVERRSYGVAAALVGTMRLIGQTLSMGVATMIFSVFVGRARITAENQEAFLTALRTAFKIFAVACFAGIFISLARGRLHKSSV
jgi:EmrB/QacA subfamily drug resistance transporter